MTASTPEKVSTSRGFNLMLKPEIRAALEEYRRNEGYRSVGEAVREMIARSLAEAAH